ncbi:MAG: hypothetical protein IJL12_03740 [Selenomonadaceae bacterium]|nr:hypothetical protein [Selenomonadaceae bacterium]
MSNEEIIRAFHLMWDNFPEAVTIQSSDTISGAIVFADMTWHFTHSTKP